MSRKSLAITIFLLSFALYGANSLTLNQNNQFFPDWTNCHNNSAVEFIDFYFDHRPTVDHKVNTITFCAGQGKDLKLDTVSIQVQGANTTKSLNETYPGLVGANFRNGMYRHCLQAGILEFPEPGDYNLTLRIHRSEEGQRLLGCLEATWTIY